MSLEEYASGLVSIAMGWLGWDLDKAMRSDCLAIKVAYEGRCDMLSAIFGGSEKSSPNEPDVSERPLSPELFDAVFG